MKNLFTPLAAVAFFSIVGTSQAFTTITNDAFTTNNDPLPSDYGDNVSATGGNYVVTGSGTPNITLTPSTTNTGQIQTFASWEIGREPVVQLDAGNNLANATWHFAFIPEVAFAVQLLSFDLDEHNGGGNTVFQWTIDGSTSGSLASGIWDEFNTTNDPGDAGGRTTFTPNVTGVIGETVTLSFDYDSGNDSFHALDNLAFAQVPEPSRVVLILIGLLGLGLRRRRI